MERPNRNYGNRNKGRQKRYLRRVRKMVDVEGVKDRFEEVENRQNKGI